MATQGVHLRCTFEVVKFLEWSDITFTVFARPESQKEGKFFETFQSGQPKYSGIQSQSIVFLQETSQCSQQSDLKKTRNNIEEKSPWNFLKTIYFLESAPHTGVFYRLELISSGFFHHLDGNFFVGWSFSTKSHLWRSRPNLFLFQWFHF